MINPQWLELPMSRTNFHGPKDVEPLRFDCILLVSKIKYASSGPKSPKTTGKKINSLSSKNESIPVPLDDMFEYFKSLNSNEEMDPHEQGQTTEILTDLPNPENNEPFRFSKDALDDIRDKEINTAIKLLKLNKSSGVDEILNENIICPKHIFVLIYRKLFNLILENGISAQ